MATWALAAAAFAAAVLATAAAGSAARRSLTVYAVGTADSFINHADDRARGAKTNPFNADTAVLGANGAAKEKGKGPYPGDNAIYGFKLYASRNLKKSIGTATYSCTFNFEKQALCEASFDLGGGMLFASGPADFTSTNFTLVVTGGTARFFGRRGQVASSVPAGAHAKNEQRLDFVFAR